MDIDNYKNTITNHKYVYKELIDKFPKNYLPLFMIENPVNNIIKYLLKS